MFEIFIYKVNAFRQFKDIIKTDSFWFAAIQVIITKFMRHFLGSFKFDIQCCKNTVHNTITQ